MEFGVAKRTELIGSIGAAAVRAAMREGTLTAAGRGWVADATADPRIVRALSYGARLTCLSALEQRGLWVPEHSTECWSTNRRHSGRLPGGIVIHPVRRWHANLPMMPFDTCIRHVLLYHDMETALIVLESAIEHEQLTESRARSFAEATSQRSQRALRFLTAGAQSGTETRVRLFLQRQRIGVQAQVAIAGVGRVDLLVGTSMVIECDSHAHHSGVEAEERDNGRDLELIKRGYTVLRLSYEQIFLEWEATQNLLLDLVRRRQHHRQVGKCAS